MNNESPNEMSKYSIIQLLDIMTGTKPDSRQHQLVKIELKKREMAEQHELNNQLIKRQHELNLKILDKQAEIAKRSAKIGLIGVIAGTIIGSVLTLSGQIILSRVQSPTQKVSTEQSSLYTIETNPLKSLNKEDHKNNAQPETKEKNASGLLNEKTP